MGKRSEHRETTERDLDAGLSCSRPVVEALTIRGLAADCRWHRPRSTGT